MSSRTGANSKLLTTLAAVAAAVIVASTTAAVEVRLQDGTTIVAEEVKVTGSYVMLTLESGQQVAYPLGDVDPSSLPGADAVADEEGQAEPVDTSSAMSRGRSLQLDADRAPGEGSLSITDEDVAHVRPAAGPQGGEAPGEGDEAEGDGATAGQTSGGVHLQGLNVTPGEQGGLLVQAEAVNRLQETVLDVKATVSTEGASTTVAVAGSLAPDQSARFSASLAVDVGADAPPPRVSVDLVYTEVQTTRTPVRRRPERSLPGPPVPGVTEGAPPQPTPPV